MGWVSKVSTGIAFGWTAFAGAAEPVKIMSAKERAAALKRISESANGYIDASKTGLHPAVKDKLDKLGRPYDKLDNLKADEVKALFKKMPTLHESASEIIDMIDAGQNAPYNQKFYFRLQSYAYQLRVMKEAEPSENMTEVGMVEFKENYRLAMKLFCKAEEYMQNKFIGLGASDREATLDLIGGWRSFLEQERSPSR